MVALGQLARQIDRPEVVLANADYRLLGMRSKIGGPFVRETKKGAEISATKLNKVRAGDFIYSRLFAWQGSFGLIPPEMDGCYVSNEFPLFELNREIVKPEYLVYWFGLPHIQKRVESDCSGSTPGTRNRYKEAFFQCLEVPLPSLDCQSSLVRDMRSAIQKIDEANRLRAEIQEELDALPVAMAHRADLGDSGKCAQGWRKVSLNEVLAIVSDPVTVRPGEKFPHFGIYSYARGLFRKSPLIGEELKAVKLYRVHEGQFIYARLNAYEGAFGLVRGDFDKHYVSNEFPTFAVNEKIAKPEFLLAYFSSPYVWENLKKRVTGIGGGAGNRRIRMKEKTFLGQQIWLPPLAWQRRVELAAKKVREQKRQAEIASRELDALLPSVLDRAFASVL